MFRNAHWYLLALLVVVVVGFWDSYFSQSPGEVMPSLHAHGIPMVIWLLMLIVQPWLISNGRVKLHRAVGRSSYVLFPIIAVTAVYVVFQDIHRNHADPTGDLALIAFFSGFLFVIIMVVFYGLAIFHRRDVQLHSRYMLSTAFPLVTPGLFRLINNVLEPIGIPNPGFIGTLMLVGIIPLALVIGDKIKGRIYPPFVYLTLAWLVNMLGIAVVPHLEWWRRFTVWSHSLGVGA